jgi:hypothetical protein
MELRMSLGNLQGIKRLECPMKEINKLLMLDVPNIRISSDRIDLFG